jgi:hypothetical protein
MAYKTIDGITVPSFPSICKTAPSLYCWVREDGSQKPSRTPGLSSAAFWTAN